MPDYSKGKIYKICSDDPDITDVYIGSTVRTLEIRMSSHRHDFIKNKEKTCASCHMFKTYGIDAFHIELIENYPCESESQLLMREQYYIDINKCVNQCAAYRTEEEKLAYIKKYNDEHTEHRKIYHDEHKEYNNDRSKAYYEAHKEEQNIKNKNYHAIHYDEIRSKASKKIMCECGIEYTHAHKTRHQKTQAHNDALTIITLRNRILELEKQAQSCP